MIELSQEPQRLMSTFLAYRNDIDIYTEDNEKDKEFYKVLFKRLIKNDIVINDVTPLGNKQNVIERCKNEPENGRKKLFIIDGDITIIHGENLPNLPNLFILEAYCIENFLINKNTIVQFLYMSCGTKSIEEIESELEYENWLLPYTEPLIDLFIHFALINYFGGYFTLYNANKFHIRKEGALNFEPELVNIDVQTLKKEILVLTSEENFNIKYNELKEKWQLSIDNLLTVVSGKDYLIPILLIKSSTFRNSLAMPRLEEVKFSLVHNSDLSKLNSLKLRIESL